MRPWYMNPLRTAAVLNRIARRYMSLTSLREGLDYYTTLLWTKQEKYIRSI